MRDRAARLESWLATHPVEIVFTLLVVAAFAYTLRISGDLWFWADEWRLIKQGGSLDRLFDQYNGHLSLNILVSYQVLIRVFGFAYTPFLVVGWLGLYSVPLAYALTARRQLGAPLAALLALPLLWYGRHISLYPGEINHTLALLGAVGCAAALNRGRRADWVLLAALAFALCSAGGGIAVAAACLVHNACTRPPIRRWLVVIGPALAWFVWWLIAVGGLNQPALPLTTSQTADFVRDLAFTPFDSIALGSTFVAAVLAVVFVGYGIWTLTRGLVAGANFIAWSIAVAVWAVGLANSRGLFADPEVFRYRYFALGLVLLAVVPRRPIVWPERFPIATNPRWLLGAAVVILLLGAARGLAARGDLQDYAAAHAITGRVSRETVQKVELGPAAVPDATNLGFDFGRLTAGDLRALFERYGSPFPAAGSTGARRVPIE